MLSKIKFNNISMREKKLYIIAIVSGVMGVATLGLCNTVAAMEQVSHNTSTDISASSTTMAADNSLITVTGCPGNCALCGLCSSAVQPQSETQMADETNGTLIN